MENFEQGRKFSTSKSLHVFCKYNVAFIVLYVCELCIGSSWKHANFANADVFLAVENSADKLICRSTVQHKGVTQFIIVKTITL